VESGKTVLAIETGFSSMGSVIYSPDTTMIATGGYKREEEEYLKIWDAKTGKLVANLKGHTLPVNCLAWTADGKTLISGSDDYSIRTWNTTTWLQTAVWTGHTESPTLSMALQSLRMAESSQAHPWTALRDCGTSRTASPSVRPSSMTTHCTAFRFR
jgi:WD40 repeat protein